MIINRQSRKVELMKWVKHCKYSCNAQFKIKYLCDKCDWQNKEEQRTQHTRTISI